jgi:hypothetical protein
LSKTHMGRVYVHCAFFAPFNNRRRI